MVLREELEDYGSSVMVGNSRLEGHRYQLKQGVSWGVDLDQPTKGVNVSDLQLGRPVTREASIWTNQQTIALQSYTIIKCQT